jgi:hypothetical protein
MRAAVPVGIGVPRDRRGATPKSVRGGALTANLVDQWLDTPTMANQINNPELWKSDREEVIVYDLSKPDELAAYNSVLTKVRDPKTNVFINAKHTEKFDDTHNWKVLLELSYVKFRVIMETKEIKSNATD